VQYEVGHQQLQHPWSWQAAVPLQRPALCTHGRVLGTTLRSAVGAKLQASTICTTVLYQVQEVAVQEDGSQEVVSSSQATKKWVTAASCQHAGTGTAQM
jgi:hypothetical protein